MTVRRGSRRADREPRPGTGKVRSAARHAEVKRQHPRLISPTLLKPPQTRGGPFSPGFPPQAASNTRRSLFSWIPPQAASISGRSFFARIPASIHLKKASHFSPVFRLSPPQFPGGLFLPGFPPRSASISGRSFFTRFSASVRLKKESLFSAGFPPRSASNPAGTHTRTIVRIKNRAKTASARSSVFAFFDDEKGKKGAKKGQIRKKTKKNRKKK